MKKTILKFVFIICVLLVGDITCLGCEIDVSNCISYHLDKENMTAKIKSIARTLEKGDIEDEFVLNIPDNIVVDDQTYSVIGFDSITDNGYVDLNKISIPKTFINTPSNQEYLNLFNFIDSCGKLTFVFVDPCNSFYSSDPQGLLFNKDKTKLVMCPRGKRGNICIPDSVKVLDLYCFKNCNYIPGNIEIPPSVVKIEKTGVNLANFSGTEKESQEDKCTIICLIGESGSGKSAIGDYLEKIGYTNVPTYTTRAKRFASEGGHFFVDDRNESDLVLLPDGEKKIAYIAYFSGNWYWLFEHQLQIKTAIAFNPYAVENLKSHLNSDDFRVVTIYLRASQDDRYSRMVDRMSKSGKSKTEIEEIVRNRMLSETTEYSSFCCDYVLNTSINIDETIQFLNKFLIKNRLR